MMYARASPSHLRLVLIESPWQKPASDPQEFEMKSLRRFFSRLNSWATRECDDQHLREEIEETLALQTAEDIPAGMSPGEAR